jgi:hypothetical protein
MIRIVLLGFFVAAANSTAIAADASQSMARCTIEFLKNENALRLKQGEFYDACMQAEGFKKISTSCASTDERCYSGPQKSSMYFARATDWLKRQQDFATNWLHGHRN